MDDTGEPTSEKGQWYLFAHQVPPAPLYFRARVLRQLTQVGAVAVKKSIYVLPANEETLEDLQWIRKGIVADGGDAWIFRASPVAGFTEDSLRQAVIDARDEDYRAILADARVLLDSPAETTETEIRKLERRTDAIRRIDYFGAPLQHEVSNMLDKLRKTSEAPTSQPSSEAATLAPGIEYHARRWVTRRGAKIDRISSAWLIARFIDPAPEFVFVDPETYKHRPQELRFDMFEGEFTHKGDKCTFEVLVEHFALNDPTLTAIAEIIHDIDLKESKFNRPETAGVLAMLGGIIDTTPSDPARLAVGRPLFEALYRRLQEG